MLCDCDLGKAANWVWCGLRRRRGVVGEDYHSKGRRNLGGGEAKKPLVYGVRGLLAGMGKDARHREPRDEGPMV